MEAELPGHTLKTHRDARATQGPGPFGTDWLRRSFCRTACLSPVLPEELADGLWQRPADLLDRGQVLQARGVRRTVLIESASQRFVLKYYAEPSRRHAMKGAFLRSRAYAAWRTSHRLADAGIRTPRPLAYIENRWGPLRRDSFLLYPYVEGRTLQSCFAEDDAANDPPRVDHLWQRLSRLWRQLGRLRVSLADANVANFIVDARGRLWVIDLDKTRFHRRESAAAFHARVRWQQLLRSASHYQPIPERHLQP